jgi:phage tail tape-measure protein
VAQGATAGAAVGVVAGAATAPLTGPIGAVVGGLVGAHLGSLFSFSKMKDAGEKEEGGRAPVENRHAGMLVAVAFDDPGLQEQAVDVLRRLGATQIERASGNIVDGDWADFDPSVPPDIIHFR